MAVKEVRPGETSNDNPLEKKKTRDIGGVGLEELVAKVQQKIEQKVEKVSAEQGSATELKADAGELKKQYFNKVAVEKNMDTTAARAMRGSLGGPATANDARNLKLVVLPKLAKLADPSEVATFGDKSGMSAPFKMDLSDLLGRTIAEIAQKPQRFEKRLAKLEERARLREKKFGKQAPPEDQDPNEFADEEYNRKKKSRAVAKMFEYMNKALGQKMDAGGAPAGLFDDPKKPAADDDDDGL